MTPITILMLVLAVWVLVVVPRPAAAAVGRAAQNAGASPVGSASYPVPSGAVFVSPAGSDTNPGTAAAPFRTIAAAAAAAPSSGTVVLRAGSYNEYVVVTKTVTIQNYPGEQVWLDGSIPVTGWVKDGAYWRHDGWTTRFDHSPTYTKGAPDSTNPYWQFVNPNVNPMAAHPDQVWLNDTPQRQAGSLSALTAGGFFLDEATSRLYLGSDPSGAQVRASNIAQAMSVRASGVTVRGIGIRRYAPSVYMLGGVVLEKPNPVLENVRISEMATTGVSVLGSGATLRQVTVESSGMLGIHGRYADGVRLDRVLSTKNNTESFNLTPVSGGAKLTQTRGITVLDSSFRGNFGHGFWEDMSDYNSIFRGDDFTGNSGAGLYLEISAKAIVGDCLFVNNHLDGIEVNNTSNVQIWNNTLVGNGRPLDLVQDSRRNTNPNDPAVDARIPWPDPEMPWQLDSVTVSNNVAALSTTVANCLLCVEDYSHLESAEAMKVVANGNVYNRLSGSAPTWLVVWSRGAGNPAVFTTLAAFRSATGQEARGREYTGSAMISADGALDAAVQALAPQVGLPLPSAVAAAIGRSAGTVQLGAWIGASSVPAPAPSPGVLARDDFARTVSGGWGSADVGGAWSIPAGAAHFSVAGGTGAISLNPGDGFSAGLNSVSATSTDLRLSLAADSSPGAGGHWFDVIGRDVSGVGRYLAKLQIAQSGSVNLWLLKTTGTTTTALSNAPLTGVTYSAGQVLDVRLQVDGVGSTALRLKVWPATGQEPAGWALTGSDSTVGLQKGGALGLYAYTGGSAGGGPVKISVDALTAVPVS